MSLAFSVPMFVGISTKNLIHSTSCKNTTTPASNTYKPIWHDILLSRLLVSVAACAVYFLSENHCSQLCILTFPEVSILL